MSTNQLNTVLWFAEIEQLVTDCDERPDGDARLLRRLYHLLEIGPEVVRKTFVSDIDEAALEVLLECDALESAALRILGAKIGVMQSRSPDGVCIGSIWLEGQSDPLDFRAKDVANALCGAAAAAMANIAAPVARPRRSSVSAAKH